MKNIRLNIWLTVLVFLLILGSAPNLLATEESPTQGSTTKTSKKHSRASGKKTDKRLQETMARAEAAEQRVQNAEKRAQAAEAAAAKAASDARAAQDQASQALDLARRASEALTRVQESLARVEQTTNQNATEVVAIKKTDEKLVTDITTVETQADTTAKKADATDKRTVGVMTTVSKIPVKIYGNVLINSNYVDRGANITDIPLFAQKRDVSSNQNHQNFNMTLRQTRFGLRYEDKVFKDAKLTGVFEFDLLGGKPAFANGVNFDIFRLRLAYGRIDWAKDSFEAGQDWAVFSPLNPTTIASFAIPGFSTSGNLWIRSPQFRYEHRETVGEKSKVIFTVALLDPNAGDNAGNPAVRVIGLGERGSIPAFEGRLGFTTQTHERESSAGISGHYSRLLGAPGNPAGTTFRSSIDSYGVGGDWNLWLSSGVRLTGEAFHGRALGIFSGNIAQSVVVINGRARGVNSTGGWIELHAEAPPNYQGQWKKFSANFGYGQEDNRGRDLVVGMRKKNQTYMMNGQYKLTPNITFALEYRRLITNWFLQKSLNQRLNWGNFSVLYSF